MRCRVSGILSHYVYMAICYIVLTNQTEGWREDPDKLTFILLSSDPNGDLSSLSGSLGPALSDTSASSGTDTFKKDDLRLDKLTKVEDDNMFLPGSIPTSSPSSVQAHDAKEEEEEDQIKQIGDDDCR
jgi:hypothetical protein